MWDYHYISPVAQEELENTSEDSFKLLFNLLGNRPDFSSVSGQEGWDNPNPLKKSDVSENYEEIISNLNHNYNFIDDIILAIRQGVHIVLDKSQDKAFPTSTHLKSILEIEKGTRTKNAFFYGVVSVLGRNITNSVAYNISSGKDFSPKALDGEIELTWGKALLSSNESMTPQEKFEKSNIREGLRLVKTGYDVLTGLPAEIGNLTNVSYIKLKSYDLIAKDLADAGHYKTLFKTLDGIGRKEALFKYSPQH